MLALIPVPGLCSPVVSTLRTGATVRTTVQLKDLSGPPPFPRNAMAEFGPLPAGTYTYEVFIEPELGTPAFTTTFFVEAVRIVPTLNDALLAALTFVLAAAAALRMTRGA